jgi:biopolymer transport protein ExbD
VGADSAHSVLVSADAKLPYEKVVEVLDLVKKAGARKYALRVRTDV